MVPLADWTLQQGGQERKIELYWGDLSYLPPEHAVDVLVVSAFRNDYIPTPSSLIGALHRNGISVYKLSFAKQKDMREEFSCWLSTPLIGVSSFDRILCVESGWRGTPPELADALFRAIAPMSVTDFPNQSVAMPLIGTGDQGYAADEVLESVLLAAVNWFRRGMPIRVLKIVAYSNEAASLAKKRFLEIKNADKNEEKGGNDWDVFLSYSHKDAAVADHIHQSINRSHSHLKIFRDAGSLSPGTSWLMNVADAIDTSRCVLSLYTPDYWASTFCKDELSAAYVRQSQENNQLLFPIFFQDTKIPSYFEALHYADCREADLDKLALTCSKICSDLSGSSA